MDAGIAVRNRFKGTDFSSGLGAFAKETFDFLQDIGNACGFKHQIQGRCFDVFQTKCMGI